MSEEGLTTISPQSSYEEDEQGDFTRWRFDIGEQLRDFEHGMTGERKTRDRDGLEKWEPIEGITPSMTAEGAREIVSPLKVLVNQVTLLSGLERNEILSTCKDINDDIVGMIFDNWELWKIDKSKMDMIVSKTKRFLFLALKQAEGARTLDSLTKVEQIIRRFSDNKKDEGINLSPFNRGEKGEST